MSEPAISVLVPTYNRSAYLGDCLASLLDQTHPAAQILVIDDCSTDATPDLLRHFNGRIDALRTAAHSGKSAALNLGLRQSTGQYVWIFDDDDVAVPDALERFAEPLERDASLGFSYSHYWYTPSRPDGKLDEPTSTSVLPDVAERGFLVPLLEFNFLGGAALFARKACYDAVGDFDVNLVRSQDYEMAVRIAVRFRGEQVRGGPTFHYRQHPGPRGGRRDTFDSHQRPAKWLEYDQIILKRLYEDLPLTEYLPHGASLATDERAARLQRSAVMAWRDLWTEALTDLSMVASQLDQSPLSPFEVSIVASKLAGYSWYGGGLRTDPRSLARLTALARESPVMHEVRSYVTAAVRTDLNRALRALVRGLLAVDVRKCRTSGIRIRDLVAQRLALGRDWTAGPKTDEVHCAGK